MRIATRRIAASGNGRPVTGTPDIAPCLDMVRLGGAASVPLLPSVDAWALQQALSALRFRRARRRVGSGESAVTQDFAICEDVPAGGLIGAWTARVAEAVNAALARMPSPPVASVAFNDVVAQRYWPVSCGISPHRDHLRYVNLVAILVVSGSGRFYICDDRGGSNAREIPAPAGSLLLMRAPGFDGSRHRPFHMLGAVTRERLILGLRQDSRKTGETG